jgi:glycosyltransferase involved in cell wall biosynthesis
MDLRYGGQPRAVLGLSRALAARGFDVEIVTLRGGGELPGREDLGGTVSLTALPALGRGTRAVPAALRELGSQIARCDLVHLYGLYDALVPAAAWFAHSLGKPYFLEPLGMLPARGRRWGAKQLYNRFLTEPMARHAAALIAATPLEAAGLHSVFTRRNVLVRPYGIDLDAFSGVPDRTTARRTLGLPDRARLVLFLGRITPIKNLELLIRAFGAAALADSTLLLCGPVHNAAYAAHLQALAAKLSPAGAVCFPGPVFGTDRIALLAAADLFVLSSHSESFGLVALEAAAAGTPVLVTTDCGVAPLVHGRAGLSVPGDLSPMAAGIRRLVLDGPFRNRVTRDREALLRELTWERAAEQTEELYQPYCVPTAAPRASGVLCDLSRTLPERRVA